MASEPTVINRAEAAKARLMQALMGLEGLPQIEALMEAKFTSDVPVLQEIPHYLRSLGGKRVRPMLTLLVAKALGMRHPSQPLIDVAAGIELIHMATLLHDDIIDRSPLRRHKESAFVRFGMERTLLSGDFLLVRAFSLCAKLDAFVIDCTERACVWLTEGETLESHLHDDDHTVESSITIAKKKTAALFRLACECGSPLSGAPAEVVSQLGEFGERIGIAFQIVDDVLDVVASEAELGKKPGTDLRERKPSLVNVLWLQSGSPLAQTLRSPPTADDERWIETALRELRGNPVVAQAQEMARQHTERALELLTSVSRRMKIGSAELDPLQALAEYALHRAQ